MAVLAAESVALCCSTFDQGEFIRTCTIHFTSAFVDNYGMAERKEKKHVLNRLVRRMIDICCCSINSSFASELQTVVVF